MWVSGLVVWRRRRAPDTEAFYRHTFCQHCILQAIEASPVCPIDRASLGKDDFEPAAKIISNMVNELVVYCPRHEQGCPHVGQRQFIESHLKNDCEYTVAPCELEECKELLLKKDLESHAETCKYRMLECNMCKKKLRAFELEVSSIPLLVWFILLMLCLCGETGSLQSLPVRDHHLPVLRHFKAQIRACFPYQRVSAIQGQMHARRVWMCLDRPATRTGSPFIRLSVRVHQTLPAQATAIRENPAQ